ncbi:TPA: hypothetical protein EYO12_03210 [Candidatus Saccharibacteria bacterium]|nr:hypothetical protein [Candidatus Saccharibacteria bacterium]HIO87958.1 hypothetical protein [Candidatus Saccharibacteria bacterium]
MPRAKKKQPTSTTTTKTIEQAKKVLDINFKDGYTMPSKVLYPHQWLWDSCFHAIGLRHHRPDRALEEIKLLLRGQWPNGMVPHMIFSGAKHGHQRYNIWKSHVCDDCVVGLRTSAITQPPVIAWAFEKVVNSLPKKDQKAAIEKYLPQIIRYHQWLYADRDPDQTGRIVIIHPWESGLDNNPALMAALRECFPVNTSEKIFLTNPFVRGVYHKLRKDIQVTSAAERSRTVENWMFARLIARYRRKLYKTEAILYDKNSFVVEDVSFNAIFIRSNAAIKTLAKKIKLTLPDDLTQAMDRSDAAFADFWNDDKQAYLSRNWHTKQSIPIETIEELLPLITSIIPKSNAKKIVTKLESNNFFTPKPVSTNNTARDDYDPIRYWQGPVWVNMNWMIIEGLKNYGYTKKAKDLANSTIKLVEENGIWEYYNSQTGMGHGISSFSWTAALYLDLINS